MTEACEFLWYIPNDVKPGHRGNSATGDHNSLDTLTSQALALERFGWKGALIGTGWGGPTRSLSQPHSQPAQERSSR